MDNKDEDFITVGDRVVVRADKAFMGSSDLHPHDGKRGVVVEMDNWGLCTVKLDDGIEVDAWNLSGLRRE